MTGHLREEAELYSLGMLEEDARREVERHVATCASCAHRITQAQLGALSLAAALPEVAPSPALALRIRDSARTSTAMRKAAYPNFVRFALAAAVLLVFLGLGLQTLVLRQRLDGEDVALVTMVHSHFNHVSMMPKSSAPVSAKVLYARDGSWTYVIADNPGGVVHVMAHTAVGTIELGVLRSAGRTATLFVHPRERIQSIDLQRAGISVASATLTYPRAQP